MDSTFSEQPRRPGTRPFISGRPAILPAPLAAATAFTRPFPITPGRVRAGASAEPPRADAPRHDAPQWSVAVYEKGLERQVDDRRGWIPPTLQVMPEGFELPTPAVDDLAEVSLALAEAVNEADRHAASLAAAEILDGVARRLRSGEILIRPGGQNDAAILASVLSSLLGDRR